MCAFLGCLYAGTVAVTASLPKGDRRIERVLSITDDSKARFALTDNRTLVQLRADVQDARLNSVGWITVDDITPESAQRWIPPTLSPDSLAFLQYTSGSTSSPKGVMLTHGNLISNEALMVEGMGHHSHSVFVSWLPLFHDMGLIAVALSSLYNGVPCYLMSPDEFVRRPILWLEAISKYRGTVTAAPDFAYRLCVDQISLEQVATLDLSSMQTMISGAEPIRMGTIECFVERFRRAGLRAESLYAGYGLAESTVYVSGEHIRAGVRSFDRKALEQDRVIEGGKEQIRLVNCGRATSSVDIRIVDPESHRHLPEKEVGEIWVNSPSNGKGYWGQAELSRETFEARIEGTDLGPYLRTGDLGFVVGDRLY
ncbi:MAG: AMP-binding protein, partial [Gammaproteobacteria bacterium]